MSSAQLRADRREHITVRAQRRDSDVARQAVVVVAVVFALVAAVFGTGLTGGTSVRDLQGGALDADATLLAPGRPAFGIWSVVYLGLLAYAVWQALPSQRAAARQRSLGWWIAGTAVLNGLWLLTAQYGALWMTVVVIALLLIALCLAFRRTVTTAETRSPWLDLVLIDGVTGVHLGWVSLATVANVTAWLATIVPASPFDEALAVVVLVLVLGVGLVASGRSGWRVAPPWAMAWGALWIGIERLAAEPASALVGLSAIVAAAVLFVVPAVLRLAAALRPPD